jgi:hypothetical protein
MTDVETIHKTLKLNEGNWVCSQVFFRNFFIKDYAQRISDLRKKGITIEGKRCDQHSHKMYMYKIPIIDYTEKDQLSLLT